MYGPYVRDKFPSRNHLPSILDIEIDHRRNRHILVWLTISILAAAGAAVIGPVAGLVVLVVWGLTTGTLPAQIVPLFRFFTAACQGNAQAMRRSAYQARHLGVWKMNIAALSCLATVYLGDLRMDEVVDVVTPILADWPDGASGQH
jgi:hypothetical protein